MTQDIPIQSEMIPDSGAIECNFTILIEHNKKEYDFYQIRDLLTQRIANSYQYRHLLSKIDEKNAINLMRMKFIQQAFRKHFSFLTNKKAYFTEYKEIEGSLIITFSVVIVGVFANYGSIRETIDYFADDMQAMYNDVLPDEYMISTDKNIKTIYAAPKIPIPKPQTAEEINKNLELENMAGAMKALNTQNKVNRILIGITMFVLLLLLAVNFIGSEQDKAQLERQIEQKVQSAIQESKVEDLLRNIEGVKVGDTLVIKKLNR